MANAAAHAVTGVFAAAGFAATLIGEAALQLDAATTLGGLGTGILGSLAFQTYRLVGAHLQANAAKLDALKQEAQHRDDERAHWLETLRALKAIHRQLRSQAHTPIEGIPLRVDDDGDDDDARAQASAPAPGLYHQARTPPRRR